MQEKKAKLLFASDYLEGAHPAILQRLTETNFVKTPGYGEDEYSEAARDRIRDACGVPDAAVYFLTGGTQANATVIDSLLRPYQGVIAAETGHISTHEAGAIEAGGHKVLTLPQSDGKIGAEAIKAAAKAYWGDANRAHMVMPGMVYLSQPTEYGTLYSQDELKAIGAVCKEYKMALYVDGARLAYGLACPDNDVSLSDLASLCDVFYIGGTKCGALFGEAVVIPDPNRMPCFFTQIKQHGALLAKGRIAAIQFDVLFTDGLYEKLGAHALALADRIRAALKDKGYEMPMVSPTNQVFVRLTDRQKERLDEETELSFWERTDEDHVVMRIATSWATTEEDVARLIELL